MERRLHVRIKGASPYGFRLVGGGGQPVSVIKVSRQSDLQKRSHEFYGYRVYGGADGVW